MSEHTAAKDLQRFIQENWKETGVPVYLENEAYEESPYYIVLTTIRADTEPMGFGTTANSYDRKLGILSFNVYGPTGQGNGVLLNLCDSLVGLMQHRTINSNIRCQTASVAQVGIAGEMSKFVYNVSVNFYRDVIIDIKP